MADLQEIIKTHTKSYPSCLDTYPRNGKTTVQKWHMTSLAAGKKRMSYRGEYVRIYVLENKKTSVRLVLPTQTDF